MNLKLRKQRPTTLPRSPLKPDGRINSGQNGTLAGLFVSRISRNIDISGTKFTKTKRIRVALVSSRAHHHRTDSSRAIIPLLIELRSRPT